MRWIGIALLALCLGCGSRRPEQVGLAVHPQLASLIPADATMAAGIKMDAVRKSPLFAKYLPEVLKRGESRGGDLLAYHEGLEEAVVASTGKKFLVAVRGKFPRKEIEDKLKAEGMEATSFHGKPGFRKNGMGVVFLADNLAMAGAEEEVLQSTRKFDSEGVMPARFVKSLQAMAADTAFWAVTIGMPALPEVPERSNLANLPKLLQGVELGTLSGRLADGLELKTKAACSSQTDAQQLETALRGAIGMARLSTPSGKPELLRAFDGIKVEQAGTDVTLDAKLPEAVIEQLRGAVGR